MHGLTVILLIFSIHLTQNELNYLLLQLLYFMIICVPLLDTTLNCTVSVCPIILISFFKHDHTISTYFTPSVITVIISLCYHYCSKVKSVNLLCI